MCQPAPGPLRPKALATNLGPVTADLIFETHCTTEDNEQGRATGLAAGPPAPAGARAGM